MVERAAQAEYVRRHRVEVLWADDLHDHMHQVTTGVNTWSIQDTDALPSEIQSDRHLYLCQAIQTHAGKEALLKALNDRRFAPEPLPMTAWERILLEGEQGESPGD